MFFFSPRNTFLAIAAGGGRPLDEVVGGVAPAAVGEVGPVGGGSAAAGGSRGEEGEVPHARALADGRAIGEVHPEDLDPAVGARPRVVPVVAAVRAPPRHPGATSASRRQLGFKRFARVVREGVVEVVVRWRTGGGGRKPCEEKR